MYLSAKTAQFFDNPDVFGCMFSYRKTGGQDAALKAGCKWMLDNGAFTGKFNSGKWIAQIKEMQPYNHNCIGLVLPDVPYDAAETIAKFMSYSVIIPKEFGYRYALATQDGMTPDMVPWPLFDVLFIGGSDAHKRGYEAETLALEAKRRGKWVHVGRVSSPNAWGKYWTWADSFDGTTFARGDGVAKYHKFTAALSNHGDYIARRFDI